MKPHASLYFVDFSEHPIQRSVICNECNTNEWHCKANCGCLALRVYKPLGITGPVTLKYRDEEAILAAQDASDRYNGEVLWPDKVRLNREYVENWSFWGDISLIMKTLSKGVGKPVSC